MNRILLAAALACLCAPAGASVILEQPPNPAGGFYHSSWWDPDGSNYDEYVWDNFVFPADADVDAVGWRGAYDSAYGGDTPVVDFTVGIYGSIPGGSEPDVAHPPLVEYDVGGTSGEIYAGVFGGVAMYDYHFTLPAPFHAQAGVPYWIQIEGWQHGYPGWSLARAASGDGVHFRCQHNNLLANVPTGCWFTRPSGDIAYALSGTIAAGVEATPDHHRFALNGATPNPARGDEVTVSFILTSGAPAELTLFDAGGRRLTSRQVGSLGPGLHAADLTPGEPIGPGVYFARLAQGRDTRTVSIVIVD